MNRVKGIQLTKLSNVLVHRKLQGSALLLAFYVLKLCFNTGRPRSACSDVVAIADERVRLVNAGHTSSCELPNFAAVTFRF